MFKIFFLLGLLISSHAHSSKKVTYPSSFRACEVDSDCKLIETLCSACCGGESINQKFVAAYGEIYSKACGNYKGGVCECYSKFTEPKCISKVCELTEKK